MKNRLEAMIDEKDTVFHYTKTFIAIEHILYENRLKFSRGMNTNDPREYSPWDIEPHLDGDYTHDEFRHEWLEAEDSYREAIMSYKYACFCSNNLQSGQAGYDRLRMWSQYGDNFYGVCIAFSADLLKQRLTSKVAPFTGKPVKYEEDLGIIDSTISDSDANEFTHKDKKVWANQYINNYLDQIFFLKHLDYRDENEYRMVVNDPNNKFEFLDISGCIRAVLLGDRTGPVYHKMIKSYCDRMNAECRQLKWQRGKLRLIDV
jgi:hypothetical protein